MTEPDQDEALRAALRSLTPGARSKLGGWYRVPDNAATIRELRAKRATWQAISALLVKGGLIKVSPDFEAESPEGEKERERVAVLAKRSWLRVEGSPPKKTTAAPPPAMVPRVRPVEAAPAIAPPPDDPSTPDPSALLARLGNNLAARSGRKPS